MANIKNAKLTHEANVIFFKNVKIFQ